MAIARSRGVRARRAGSRSRASRAHTSRITAARRARIRSSAACRAGLTEWWAGWLTGAGWAWGTGRVVAAGVGVAPSGSVDWVAWGDVASVWTGATGMV